MGGLLVLGPSPTMLVSLWDDGSFEHVFLLLVVFLYVGVQGGVGEIGSAAGTVEIAALKVGTNSTVHLKLKVQKILYFSTIATD
jgi:hypothetical protein